MTYTLYMMIHTSLFHRLAKRRYITPLLFSTELLVSTRKSSQKLSWFEIKKKLSSFAKLAQHCCQVENYEMVFLNLSLLFSTLKNSIGWNFLASVITYASQCEFSIIILATMMKTL